MDAAKVKTRRPDAAKKTDAPDPFLDPASGRFSLNRTLEFAKQLAQGNYGNRARLFQAYEKRGVDFPGSPANLQALQSAGAEPDFLNIIKRIALPYVPPAPTVVTTGTIVVSCVPSPASKPFSGSPECEIALGKRAPVATRDGKFTFEGVEPGEVALEVSKAGFVTQSRSVRVQARSISAPAITLEPNAETRIVMGKSWLAEVWKALGAGDRGAGLQEISASGSATLFDTAGADSRWDIVAKLSEKATSTLELKFPAGQSAMTLECRVGASCRLNKASGGFGGRGKRKIPLSDDDASILLKEFRRIHLGNMISRLTGPEVRVTSSDTRPSGVRSIQLESNDETYEVEVGVNMLIGSVLAKSKLGGDSYQVVYADYVKLAENAQYPRRTETRLQTGKRGIRIEFAGPVTRIG